MAPTQIPVVITYHKPGTRPPIYVAGTFSSPPWQPYEMERTRREDAEYDFTKEIRAEPGSKVQYKFRVGDGNWWVLKDDGPTVTDSAGNTNHVLEVKPQEDLSHDHAPESPKSQQSHDVGGDTPLSAAQAATQHAHSSVEQGATDRSGTGTPISARVAAEVADSAERLHEEVPQRKHAEAGASGDGGEPNAAEALPTRKAPESLESTVVILEPPPDSGRPSKVQHRGREATDDQEDFIADKSPLFAHECVGLYESDDEETGQGDSPGEDVAEDDERFYRSLVEDIDPDQIDLNDPTLERFPSARDDIMQAVRKLETGLPADQASFEGNPRSPVVMSSRRGTEDITGDFHLAAPQTPALSYHSSKRSARGSVSSIQAAASLHSISEAEEQAAEPEEANPRPAVVFTNPLKPKPKHLELPTSEEDEGVVLKDGVSPRTLKPMHRPVPMSEPSPPQSPPSTSNASGSLAPAEVELDKDRERSMQEVIIHPAPQVDQPGPAEAGPPTTATKEADHRPVPGHAQAAAADTAPSRTPSQRKPAASPSETRSNKELQQEQGPIGETLRRPRHDDDETADQSPPLSPRTSRATTESSTAKGPRASESDDSEQSKLQEVPRKRSGGGKQPRVGVRVRSAPGPAAATPGPASGAAGASGGHVPPAPPKKRGGWIRAILRFVFVEVIGRIIKGVLRLFGVGRRREAARRESVRTRA
ncbi:hypothetical protein N658DRAFT_503018 [Parathielavia hyrcaniae]|uniref:AMP-activated protein kinase glycogen-binding domain-containing protein n=1 Tax=Parathielavia hyrcaniae TaxID=113614 RepID=A0AAN6T702_9PEZI|nr:hypothetical protein N658DRAFT_503018 [Parathielavia hyrcaniae]